MSDNQTQSQQVYAALKDAICNCRYLPGQEISEKQLFEDLPFGRTPIRETLLQLQREELVEIFPRKGMRVAAFSDELISNIYQTRKLIEPPVAASYCPMYSKGKLLEYREKLPAAADRGAAEFYTLDIEFHTYLVSAANNRRLSAIFSDLMLHQYRLAMYAAMQDKASCSQNNDDHERILLALLSEDRDAIRASITSHINASMITLMQALH